MRIFLTGATGFLGSHLLRLLLREGVTVAALFRPEANRWRLDGLSGYSEVSGAMENIREAEPAIAQFAPDTIIHLAWSGVGNQRRNDLSQIENLTPTLDLVRLGVRLQVKTWIGLGSQAEYGPQNRRITETDPTEPTTLYGASKLAACHLARALCEQNGIRFAWLRVFSTYGPMDDPNWLIPYMAGRLLARERPALTAGEQNWDYLFAPDAAAAIWKTAQSSQAKGIFNLGSGQVYTLRSIVEKVRNLIDPKLPLGFGEVPYRPDQVMHLEADISRLRAATGWSPRVSLDEGLKQTVDWIRLRRAEGLV